MDTIVRVGLIGFGLAGRVFHAPIINSVPGLKLRKIFERKAENIDIIREKYPQTIIVDDVENLFNDENIDLVVIAAPNELHYKLAKKALESGKHVVVEKPFTVTTYEAEELITLALAKGKLITAFQNRRWDSDFRTVKKIIDGGLLGDVVEYEAHFDRFRNYFKNNWREKNIPGSGILYDLGSHLIDQAISLFGNPIEIFGNLLIQRRGGEAVDNFEVILRYQDKKVTLKSGMLVRQPLPHFIVIGTKGSFIKYGMDVQEENLKNGNTPSNSPNWGRETEDLWGFINSDINGNHIIGKVESEPGDYRCFYENVYKAILGKEDLIVKPTQVLSTIKVIEMAMRSHEEKRWMKFF
ncbi:MAG: oxidoreductase [Clostridiales bacterium]|mgnify:CR=1 FL=1|uniref:oxidoreductase n=1 Tax=Clostridium sp. N3C TaxID=1776758 RepID=UPI00092DFEE1|nr:oxidoreductase [Clostridium sp. N3C]NLZ47182.1 oxidoreductase [Clostridiales bacterium]SCN23583.1 putative oxidoreductase YdgJ [Clostridium sp. N3C]